MRAMRTMLAAGMMMVAGACAPAAGTTAYAPGLDGVGPEETTVRVENNNWDNMTVYVVRGSARHRLGMVTSMNAETFRIPAAFMSGTEAVRLVADPIGSSNTYVTPSVQVKPGEQIEFDIENHLAISSVSVWSRR